MSDEPNQVYARERGEPTELQTALPMPFAVMSLALIAWGGAYFFLDVGASMDAGDRRTAAVESMQHSAGGSSIYSSQCAACHQSNGEGLAGVFPPLAGSEWVVDSPELITQVVLHGLTGRIEVAGQPYDGVMPAFVQLTDEEIADLVNFVTTELNQKSSTIDSGFVQAQRSATSDRVGPWLGEKELRDWLGVQKHSE